VTDNTIDPNAKAAHEFLADLRTRITVQPLSYQDGDENRALESLVEVFSHARKAIKENPGCETFARQTSDMLNKDLRPVTAKWHPIAIQGELGTRDGSAAFRSDLASLQKKLRAFANILHQMAYGSDFTDAQSPPALDASELKEILAELPYGIPEGHLIDDATRANINESEAAEIAKRRGTKDPISNGVGLALSGGGIRSASFCLGVCQALADHKMLEDIDLLSTVSGGGYTGAFVSRQMEAKASASLMNRNGPDTPEIRALRSKVKFMTPSGMINKWGMICSILAGMILNWTAPATVICIFVLVLILLEPIWSPTLPYLPQIALLAGTVGLVAYALQLRRNRVLAIKRFAIFAAFAAMLTVIMLVPVLYTGFKNLTVPGGLSMTYLTISAAIAAASPALTRISTVFAKPMLEKTLLRAALLLASIAVPLIGLIFGSAMWDLAHAPLPAFVPSTAQDLSGKWLLAGLAVILGLMAWLAINLNLNSPGRLYRNRLAQSFVATPETPDSFVPLTTLNATGKAPYHLINTTLNVPGSTSPSLRERRGDFFVMSKHWVGAPSSGYAPTKDWKTSDGELDLATAISTSGAAVSPHMALMTVPSITALLSFLNLRLAYWLRKPAPTSANLRPGFQLLLKEMFSWGLTEKADWLLLSDGAHVDNSGIYELLRRRCKFIIACDVSTDTDGSFSTMMTLVRHAQIDFGIQIIPHFGDLGADLITGQTNSHTMMCQIKYPGEPDGLLLLLKSSITGNEPELIKTYRANHHDFPYQTTLDQSFDEGQFEAYRQLGAHVVDGLFAPSVLGQGPEIVDVSSWFERLAANLLPRQT